MTKWTPNRRAGWAVVVMAIVVAIPTGKAAWADDKLIELKADKDTDETLFLVRVLENTYAQWPRANVDPVVLRHWIKGTRLRLVRLQKHAEGDLNPQIVTLYRECLELLTEYERFLVTVGAIKRGTADVKDYGSIGMDAVGRGFGVTSVALTNPLATVTLPYALAAGGVVSVGAGVYDLYKRYNTKWELDERKKQALDDQATLINNRFEATYVGAETVVKKLKRKFGWGSRCGFDGSIRKSATDQLTVRPNDPFAIVLAAQAGGDGSANDLMRRAHRCLDAARLVPDGEVYEPFRAEFVAVAARLSLEASIKQLEARTGGNPAYSAGPVAMAEECVRIHRTYLVLEPADPGKVGHRELARALACAGRFDDAVEAANEAFEEWKRDRGFIYRYARLMSLRGNEKKAMECIKWETVNGFTDVMQIINDPDLNAMRKAFPKQFAELIDVEWGWSIDWGIVSRDAITVMNKSWFPIHDVSVKVVISSPNGSKKWEQTLRCATLHPGERKRWNLQNPGITYRGADYKANGTITYTRGAK